MRNLRGRPERNLQGNTRMDAVLANSQDLDLESRVLNYLLGYRMPALRSIEVEARNGVVTLRGSVPTYYQKQLALNCCRRVAGVVELIEEVDVASYRAEPLLVA